MTQAQLKLVGGYADMSVRLVRKQLRSMFKGAEKPDTAGVRDCKFCGGCHVMKILVQHWQDVFQVLQRESLCTCISAW